MAKYTIELGTAIDRGMINWDDIMTGFPDGGDAEWKTQVSNLIRDHYWFREIGFETPQMFSFYMKRTLREIGPYYVDLKKANELELGVDPLETYSDIEEINENSTDEISSEGSQSVENTSNQTRTDDLSSNTNSNSTSEVTSTNKTTSENNSDGYVKNYNIPMNGGSSGEGPGGFSDDFATSGQVNHNESNGSADSNGTTNTIDNTTTNSSNTGTQNLESNGNNTSNSNSKQNINKENHITRNKHGNSSPKFELMAKYRDVIINLNMKIVMDKNISQCFMGVF